LPQAPQLVASTAIGIPRYFGDVDVLDLVGLTDTTIARHPVRHADIRDDHILRNYHVDYVLHRAPEHIFFIAGARPATPAERALYLSPRFRRNYVLQYPRDDRPVHALRGGRPTAFEPLATDGRFSELFSDGLGSLKTNPAAARTLLLDAVRLAPADFEDPHYWLGWLAASQGDEAEARQRFLQVIDLEPEHAMAYTQLATLDLKAGRLAAAIRHGRRARSLAPQSNAALHILGRALLAAGDLDEAVLVLRQAAQRPGGGTVDAMLHLGIAEDRRGNASAARAAWEAVLAVEPDNAQARTLLR
ncbi:MAG: tetratricopeptide repeat protein, partial [Pirellulaceae bacterium]|nr:tetratricopeptide repeat protein [Pirellulaceae bacterium]